MVDYSLAEEYSDCVHALAIVESNENPFAWGDDGKAFGLLQMHSATFKQYYGLSIRFPPSPSDTVTEAQIKACAGFLDVYHRESMDLRVQAWNLGVHEVFDEGKRNPEYLKRYTEALNKVRAIHR